MKLIDIKSLAIPDVKVIKFGRFPDHRGYFTEIFRKNDFDGLEFFKNIDFLQGNESFSKPNTVRGLHFQWSPSMGKLVRTVQGRMVDLVMDIRKGSPTIGKIIAYDMPAKNEYDWGEWIWVPPGFAHGNYFSESTTIQYFCSASYNPEAEAGISPLANDLDWSLCDQKLREEFLSITASSPLMTEKDINGYALQEWLKSPESDNYLYEQD